MDNPKSWGKNNRTNKAKYKNKPNKSGSHAPAPKLESNWGRYEEEPKETKLSTASDFSVLANAPITHGSHFQFKSDKDIEISDPVEASKLFTLDLTLLDKSLSTIPFNVRSEINIKHFTENQQKIMMKLDDKINDYVAYLSSYQKVEPDVDFGSEGEPSDENVCDKDKERDIQPGNSKKDTTQQPPKPPERREDDLEQWLDDILDD